MNSIDAIAAEARLQGLKPWILLKEKLARCAIEVMATSAGAAVLQGGAALHFAYGSPRLSADVDFVGLHVGQELEQRGQALAGAAHELLGCPSHWSFSRSGRLTRGKVTLEMDDAAARLLVLPIEAYEIPSRLTRTLAGIGAVEDPQEIMADKIVASADRLARRGTLKLTDLYDLWYLRVQLGIDLPNTALVIQKAADYAQPPRGADLANAVRNISLEELRTALEGVLPASALGTLDEAFVLATAAEVLDGYRHVL